MENEEKDSPRRVGRVHQLVHRVLTSAAGAMCRLEWAHRLLGTCFFVEFFQNELHTCGEVILVCCFSWSDPMPFWRQDALTNEDAFDAALEQTGASQELRQCLSSSIQDAWNHRCQRFRLYLFSVPKRCWLTVIDFRLLLLPQ